MRCAIAKVEKNNGAPGIDGMKTHELRPWFNSQGMFLKTLLDQGHYKPRPIKRVTIPKPQGGTRKLGIPTATDRVIQQTLLGYLTDIVDQTFSDASYGFRPYRSAHQAAEAACKHLNEGFTTVIEIDLQSFFDEVNHDTALQLLGKHLQDKRVIDLLRRFLKTDVIEEDGTRTKVTKGTPQGGPLSPFIANVVLDVFDKELERRGHRFVRYADDIRIFVRTEKAAKRVLDSATKFLEKKLKLPVNKEKSTIAKPSNAAFLGFGFKRQENTFILTMTKQSKQRFKAKVKEHTRRHNGTSTKHKIERLNEYLRGWAGYFYPALTRGFCKGHDQWIRKRLRAIIWIVWKTPKTRQRKLQQHGLSKEQARNFGGSSRGPWNAACHQMNLAITNAKFDKAGLFSLLRWFEAKKLHVS